MADSTRHSPKPNLNSEILDRLPPHDAAAEEGLVGSLLMSHEFFDQVADIAKPEDCHTEVCRVIYQVIWDLERAGRHSDETTVTEAIRRDGKWKSIGGMESFLRIVNSVAVAMHAPDYARIVAEKARLRRLIREVIEVLRQCYAETDLAETIAGRLEKAAHAAIGDVAADSIVTASDAARLACERFDTLRTRPDTASVLTGLKEIDTGPGGLFPGELTVLAARPGVGKTSLALQIALHCGLRDRLTYFATAEMGAAELAARKLCGMAHIDGRKARTGELDQQDMAAIVEACNEFARARLWIDQRPRMTTADIRRGAKRAAQQGLSLVCVDYLGLLRPTDPKAPREQQVASQAWDMKQLARELNVPVLLLSQLNRQAIDEFEQPRLSHLRESGAIEQHADAVWFLWANKPKPEKNYNACFGAAKNRNGETGMVGLKWIPAETRFESPLAANYDPDLGQYSGNYASDF
jgi:replicative DNA helicase